MRKLSPLLRARLLAAAREEFLRCGYAGASMRAIASRAGVTAGNIYLYFPGKERLLDALLADTLGALNRLLDMPALTGDDSIRQLSQALCGVFQEHRAEFLILTTGARGSKYAHFKETLIAGAHARVLREFAASSGDAPFLHALTVSLIEGLLYIFQNTDGARLSGLLTQYLEHMLAGLSPAGDKEE